MRIDAGLNPARVKKQIHFESQHGCWSFSLYAIGTSSRAKNMKQNALNLRSFTINRTVIRRCRRNNGLGRAALRLDRASATPSVALFRLR